MKSRILSDKDWLVAEDGKSAVNLKRVTSVSVHKQNSTTWTVELGAGVTQANLAGCRVSTHSTKADAETAAIELITKRNLI